MANSGNPSAGRAMYLFFGLSALYMVLEITGTDTVGRSILKGTLMPALLLWAVLALGPQIPKVMVVGLVMATAGDVLLEFDDSAVMFLLGMLGFLAMQICYLTGFLRLGALDKVRQRWWIPAVYLAVWLAAIVFIASGAPDMAIPVGIYGLTLVSMAIFASGVSARVGFGGLIFVISDALIGLELAGVDFTGQGAVVMGTYLVGQYLIITGWARRVDSAVPVPA